MTYLIDSSFLVALYDKDSRHHEAVVAFGRGLGTDVLVPMVALTEVMYLLSRGGGVRVVRRFLDNLHAGAFPLVPVTPPLLGRVRAIMTDYESARLDFVDCCIMALAEQLTITKICTLDRRDFSIFRPQHCDYLELYP